MGLLMGPRDQAFILIIGGPVAAAAHRAARHADNARASSSRLQGLGTTERTTRSAAARMKPQPKLKLKLSEKAAQQAPGMSFLGSYDRELDSDDEDLAFEEQFVLRMPPGDDCERLRKMVSTREVENDVWFKFKDARRAVFHIGNNLYSAKLVDLPCIIESQKTLDNKQMFKVADICQMLVVEGKVDNEEAVSSQKNFNIDEFIWPHGITPPLHWVRKRRFRKRVNRRTIESVEEQVERLLEADAAASQVQYDVLENVNPDMSDSEFADHEQSFDAPTPAFGSELGDAPTPLPGEEDLAQDGEEGEDGEDEGDGDIDEELAAELDLALGDEDEGDDADEEDEEEESEEEEDDDEDDEVSQAKKLLNEEIRDLEAAVNKKEGEVASSANPLIRRRFEDALKKLKADLAMKVAQREEMKEKQRVAKEGGASEAVDTDGDSGPNDEDADDLFGPEESGVAMDIG
ncbi:hypothetical protein GLOTRDRAFT_110145 [Gloeophyllum trabeum ATCC 11539]|uniref:TAFII55 protein conserved region domain-containing protein n=1 Tax=Gloeophyllum trabeum (strain ATCC 11539 / FP-39264 / Madison 617) TaxID=670483 RepID=S7RUD2_GLOTA|nr:uncharacterized protein GLOTRDRAFT_110145 [Gloeophyllum trabeum ATCC 11539]EPQ58340.1 hypothetical protein GLOTRDRAFT_110145 [Gloeophyllum trabeum ATCC 11539]